MAAAAGDWFSSAFWTDVLGLDFALERKETVNADSLLTRGSTKVTCYIMI
jgi:hypothetical protein